MFTMCGVIAYFPRDTCDGFDFGDARLMFTRVMRESKIRGLHAFGIASEHILLRSHDLEQVIDAFQPASPTIAHCRYSTSGDWQNLDNCQPIAVDDYALVFNGVIHMGTKQEFEREFEVSCESENDGEIFLRRVVAGQDPAEFIRDMRGSFAGAWLHGAQLWIGRNERRPLWRVDSGDAVWIASTSDILRRAGLPPGEQVQSGVWRIT